MIDKTDSAREAIKLVIGNILSALGGVASSQMSPTEQAFARSVADFGRHMNDGDGLTEEQVDKFAAITRDRIKLALAEKKIAEPLREVRALEHTIQLHEEACAPHCFSPWHEEIAERTVWQADLSRPIKRNINGTETIIGYAGIEAQHIGATGAHLRMCVLCGRRERVFNLTAAGKANGSAASA